MISLRAAALRAHGARPDPLARHTPSRRPAAPPGARPAAWAAPPPISSPPPRLPGRPSASGAGPLHATPFPGCIAGEDGGLAGGDPVVVDQCVLAKLKAGVGEDELDQLFRTICVIRNKVHDSWEDRRGGSDLQQQVFDGVKEISVGRALPPPPGAPGPAEKYWDFVLHVRYSSPLAARQFWLTPAWRNVIGVPQFDVGAARSVLFRLKPDADPEAEAAALEGLLGHAGDIPGCLEVTTGRAVPLQLVAGGGGAGGGGGGFTHGFLARFDGEGDLAAYLGNPTHMEVMQGLFPLLDTPSAAVDANWAPLDNSLRFI